MYNACPLSPCFALPVLLLLLFALALCSCSLCCQIRRLRLKGLWRKAVLAGGTQEGFSDWAEAQAKAERKVRRIPAGKERQATELWLEAVRRHCTCLSFDDWCTGESNCRGCCRCRCR